MTENNEQKESTASDYVREVTAKYIGPRRKSISIRSANDAACFVRRLLRDEAREHFIALYLNGANQVVSHSLVSLGTANSAPACPREIFQGAVLVGACALIVAHNHPSGSLAASEHDKIITRRLAEGGKLLSIPLLDHIIVSSDCYYSFLEDGSSLLKV